MIVVTGAAGLIGSNLIAALNQRGEDDILAVDDLTRGEKFVNLADRRIADYLDKRDFRARLEEDRDLGGRLRAVFHQGACTATTEWDGRYMMANNFEYSKCVLAYCQRHAVPLIYASSAAVYGLGDDFAEQPSNERPLNVYAFSKLAFDNYVRRHGASFTAQVAGLRYFNVYGPGEAHKGRMASMVLHLDRQLRERGRLELFEGSDGYAAGEQRRDFVHVADAVAINLWLYDHPEIGGIYNVGTGNSRSFNALARCIMDHRGGGELTYIGFPPDLTGRYQSFTEADLTALRGAGCQHRFRSLEEGVKEYLSWLSA